MNLKVSNEILATQFPKLVKLERWTCYSACKEEATSANADDAGKKGHLPRKYFLRQRITGIDARKPYTGKQNTRIYPDS